MAGKDRQRVWTLNDEGRLVPIPVAIGPTNGTVTVIERVERGNLQPGTSLVTDMTVTQ
jgi:hypothetical protein